MIDLIGFRSRLKDPVTWGFIVSGAAIGFAAGFISCKLTNKDKEPDLSERKQEAIERIQRNRTEREKASYSKDEIREEIAEKLSGTPYHEWADKVKRESLKRDNDEKPGKDVEEKPKVHIPEEDSKPPLDELVKSYAKATEEKELEEGEVEEMPVITTEGFHEDAIERISQDDYLNGSPFNEKVTCTFFKNEGVLAGGGDLHQMDIGDTVGEACIQLLVSGQEPTVWIRNHELGEDYEVSMSFVPLVEAVAELVDGYLDEYDEE